MDAVPHVLDDVGRKARRKRRERKSAHPQTLASVPAVKPTAASSEQQRELQAPTPPPTVATVDLISTAPSSPPAAAAPEFRPEAEAATEAEPQTTEVAGLPATTWKSSRCATADTSQVLSSARAVDADVRLVGKTTRRSKAQDCVVRASKSTDNDTDADEEEADDEKATTPAPALDEKAVVKDKSGLKREKPDSDSEDSEGSCETDEKAASAPKSAIQKCAIKSLTSKSAPSGENGVRTKLLDPQDANSSPKNGAEPQKPTSSGDAEATGARAPPSAPATIDANPMQQQLHALLDRVGSAAFAMRPLPPGARVCCRVTRNEKLLFRGTTAEYTLCVEHMGAVGSHPTGTWGSPQRASQADDASEQPKCVFLMAARRKFKCRSLQYLISTDPLSISKRFDTYLGKLRALNFSG